VIHVAHSQGALLTSLAARQLSALEMSQIEVLTFGGAAALRRTPQTPFHRCINYYSVNDPLLFIVPSAEQALRSGNVVDEEFCFLAPRVGDPIADHHLLGPTYATALSWEGTRFRRKYQSLSYRSSRSVILFCLVLQEAFSSKLHEVLKAILRPILYCLLLIIAWLQRMLYPVSRNVNIHVVKPFLLLCQFLYELIILLVKTRKGMNYRETISAFLEGSTTSSPTLSENHDADKK
jgi:hypothetical protein